MAFPHLDKRMRPVAPLVGKDKRGDPGDISLKRQNEQIAQDADMLLVAGRNAVRLRHVGPRGFRKAGGSLDAPLDFANRVEILLQLAAIVSAEARLQGGRVFADEI